METDQVGRLLPMAARRAQEQAEEERLAAEEAALEAMFGLIAGQG